MHTTAVLDSSYDLSIYFTPLFWAVFFSWALTVAVHEFSHGLVGYVGGDHTAKERGILTLNPLKFIDPMMSIALPLAALLFGGVPLIGGATYIWHDLLRSAAWESMVSAAGPLSNFIMFLLLALPFHPKIGWIIPPDSLANVPLWMILMGALVQLQLLVVFINLIPLPPLDGYGILRPVLPPELTRNLDQPQLRWLFITVVFIVLSQSSIIQNIYRLEDQVMHALRFDADSMYFFGISYNRALFGK